MNASKGLTHYIAYYVLGLFSLLLLAPKSVLSDTLFGVYVGAGSWQNQYSGEFADSGADIDLESDLNFDTENNGFVYAAIEHPIPIIPNIRLSQTEIEHTAVSTLTEDITFVDTTFTASSSVSSIVDLTFSDVTFYYEILDNWISLDLGLVGRNFDGQISISAEETTEKVDVDVTVPLLYGYIKADLPFTGFFASSSLYALSLNDDEITDISMSIGYESGLGIGGELGYRVLNVDIEEIEDLTTDIDISGYYLAATFHF